ncbi:hypothetical protein CEXT_270991 [Caerostris extrusa]|uniref:Uncharacterized protein n=1 Tax=Caerostris extrusa TaxID=172846 RepID=A0AAV4PBI9_CAEEX|nr:hypothetical protein CEXT_270991 [Caerostris extrusa]
MSERGSSLPGTETMDVSPPGDDEQPPCRLPPDPPVGSDEYLYLHVQTITKIIKLKAKLLADWFRPKGLDPDTTSKLDKEYDTTTAEMLALCEGLGMSQNELPEDIYALHEKIKHVHLRLHEETAPSQANKQKTSYPERKRKKDPWMPRAIKFPQSILYAKILKKT